MIEAAMNDNNEKKIGSPFSSALPAEGWTAPAPSNAAPRAPKEPTGPVPSNEELKEWVRPVQDPELFMSLVDLGLIYDVTLTAEHLAEVRMTLTSPGCPAGGYMVKQVEDRLREHPGVADAKVEIVWEPKWDPKTMASEEAKEALGIW